MMEPIYWAISWILLRWHSLWDAVLPGSGQFLGTTWPWILAIVFLVITVRIILFPIFVKQIRSQRAMQALQPKMKEIQTKYKGDQQKLREETTKLFQQEKVNPLMGCLPMFLQIPVFLGLFHILNILNPFEGDGTPKWIGAKSLYGWTPDEFDSGAAARIFNAPVPARFSDSADKLDLLLANGLTVKVVAGVLVLVMMFTTYLTSRQMILKTGWNPDPQQRMIQKLMLYGIPFTLLLSGWYFPIGVIVYWVTQNLISFAQQHWVLHKYPPPLAAGAVPATGGNIFGRIPVAGESAVPPKAAPPERPIPKAKPSAGSGFVNPVQAEKEKKGRFGRKAEPAPAAPPTETKSLGPKPGAKPTRQPSGATAVSGTGGTDGGAQSNTPSKNGQPAGQKSGSSQSSASKSTTAANGQSGAAKSAAKPGASKGGGAKGGSPKKRQPSRKGGPRR